MMKKLLYILVLPIALGFMGCEALDEIDAIKELDSEKTATYPINGEFFVTLDRYNATTSTWETDYDHDGFMKIMFTNTSANDKDMVWFTASYLATAAKIKCNPATKTFTPGTYNSLYAEKFLRPQDTAAFHTAHKIEYKFVNLDKTYTNSVKDSILVSGYANTVTISAGAIELGTYKAPSKTMTDAISIELQYSNKPEKFRYKGYRRTAFLEDEH